MPFDFAIAAHEKFQRWGLTTQRNSKRAVELSIPLRCCVVVARWWFDRPKQFKSTPHLPLRRYFLSSFESGISAKTQELYLLVFLTRYLDLFMTFYSYYNMVMKIIYIVTTASLVYIIRYKEPFRNFYNPEQDSFEHVKFAVLPCSIIALVVHLFRSGIGDFNYLELLWTFSICLEPLAIVSNHAWRSW